MSIIPSWKVTAVALVAGIAIGWYITALRWDADIAKREKAKADDVSVSQQAIIAGQAFQFQRYNEIARQANQYGINIRADSDEKQIVYRTIIKRDPAGHQCVPNDVAGRLLDYSRRLRASAMHTTSSGANAAGISSAASVCRLTYAQAVYWVDPLLTALEQANAQLLGISKIELSRASHYSQSVRDNDHPR
ncbi:hypothetical protein [Lonsdalea quercina]|uniref:hypothetical protein n=1 Tax=Lonsdalea quercina TaxID=71657 RepID=UPI003976EFB7